MVERFCAVAFMFCILAKFDEQECTFLLMETLLH